MFLILASVDYTFHIGPGGISRSFVQSLFGFTPQHVILNYTTFDKGTGMKISWPQEDSNVDIWASNVREIVLDYQLEVEDGSMSIMAWGPRSFFQRWGLSDFKKPLGEQLFYTTIRGTQTDQIIFPERGSGYYRINFSPNRLTGTMDASINVR